MTESRNIAEILADWAATEPSIEAVILIGSRIQKLDDGVWSADKHSDWDFHIVTSNPRQFRHSDWARQLDSLKIRAYAVRSARISGVPKVNIVFPEVEADLVILPAHSLRILKWFLLLRFHLVDSAVRRRLQELAVVIRPGWKFLKGSNQWEPFYRRAIAAVPDPRLTNDDVCQLAEGFVCDYVRICRKIARGEFLAAQRLLHLDLIEVNFRLVHEVRLRAGKRSFPEARRIERVADHEEIAQLSIEDKLDGESLAAAADKIAASCRFLVKTLVGGQWNWPLEIIAGNNKSK